MRLVIILLFSSISFNLFAQGEIRMGLQGGLNFSYRFLSNNNEDDPMTDEIIRHYDTYETPAVAYRFAFATDFQLSKHFNFEVGASITRNQYIYSNSDLSFGDFVDPRRGFISDIDQVKTYERRVNYIYAGVPVRGIYRAGLTSLKFVGHIGVSPQILLDNYFKSTVTYQNGTEDTTQSESSDEPADFNFSPFFGVGLEWELADKWCLRTEAVARYGALDVSDQSPINTRLISSEFTAGVYYLLRSGKDSTE
jgi:hypothetical protein